MLNWIELNLNTDEDGWIDAWDNGENERQLDLAWKAGNLVRMADGKVHLVGTVNEKRGTCGCCDIRRVKLSLMPPCLLN